MKADWVLLGDILQLAQNAEAVTVEDSYRCAGILNRGRGLFDKGVLLGADTKYDRLFRLSTGQVVYSKLFGWEGATALVPAAFNGHYVSSEFPTFAPDNERIASGYLEQYMKSDEFTAQMSRSTNGLGQRRQRVNVDSFLRITVPLPPRVVQDRIAAQLRRIPFGRPNHYEKVLALSRTDWSGEEQVVGDCVEVVDRRQKPSPDSLCEMQGVRWYGEGLFTREVRTGLEVAGSVSRIEPGDLVYNRLFAWKQSFALASKAGWGSSEFPTFRVRTDRVRPRVLLAALLSPAFTARVNAASTGSTPTSRNRLKERDFLRLPITVPRPREQVVIERALLIVDRVKPLEKRVSGLASALLPAARNEIFSAMR